MIMSQACQIHYISYCVLTKDQSTLCSSLCIHIKRQITIIVSFQIVIFSIQSKRYLLLLFSKSSRKSSVLFVSHLCVRCGKSCMQCLFHGTHNSCPHDLNFLSINVQLHLCPEIFYRQMSNAGKQTRRFSKCMVSSMCAQNLSRMSSFVFDWNLDNCDFITMKKHVSFRGGYG